MRSTEVRRLAVSSRTKLFLLEKWIHSRKRSSSDKDDSISEISVSKSLGFSILLVWYITSGSLQKTTESSESERVSRLRSFLQSGTGISMNTSLELLIRCTLVLPSSAADLSRHGSLPVLWIFSEQLGSSLFSVPPSTSLDEDFSETRSSAINLKCWEALDRVKPYKLFVTCVLLYVHIFENEYHEK